MVKSHLWAWTRIIIAVVFIIGLVALIITLPLSYQTSWDDRQYTNASPTNICPIYNYGNGTLFFNCSDERFLTSLSQYIGQNHITVTAIAAAPDQLTPNDEYGYIVTVKEER